MPSRFIYGYHNLHWSSGFQTFTPDRIISCLRKEEHLSWYYPTTRWHTSLYFLPSLFFLDIPKLSIVRHLSQFRLVVMSYICPSTDFCEWYWHSYEPFWYWSCFVCVLIWVFSMHTKPISYIAYDYFLYMFLTISYTVYGLFSIYVFDYFLYCQWLFCKQISYIMWL